VFISSCGSTEEEPKNSFTYNNTTYVINDAFIQDFGDYDLIDDQVSENTHHLYLFGFTDGSIVTNEQYISENGSYAILLYSYSPINVDTAGFSEGVFKCTSLQDFYSGSEELRDEYFFTFSSLVLDANNDGFIYLDNDDSRQFNSGVVNIAGADSTFQLFFRMDLSFGKKLDGSFSGDFQFFNQ